MIKRFVIAAFCLAIYLATTLAFWQGFTQYGFGGADLVPLWLAGRALFFEHSSPYSDDVTSRSQRAILGEAAVHGGDQFAFAYPLIALLPLAPLSVLPFSIAQSAWMAGTFFMLIASTLTIAGGQRGIRLLTLMFVTIIFYPSARALALGQFAPFVLACMVLAIWAIHHHVDWLAGLALALACSKPQMAFLIVPMVCWWAWREQRWLVIKSAVVSGTALLALSLLLWPGWIGEWLARLGEYRAYAPQPAPLEMIAGNFAPLISLLVFIATLGLIKQSARTHTPTLTSLVAWLSAITVLIAPRTSVSDQVLLLVPLAYAFSAISNASRVLLLFGAALLPWLWFAFTQSNGRESPLMVLPLPLVTLGVLLWHKMQLQKQSQPSHS